MYIYTKPLEDYYTSDEQWGYYSVNSRKLASTTNHIHGIDINAVINVLEVNWISINMP